MKQVCGLGPHLHEYKCIYEHRCDKTCQVTSLTHVGFKVDARECDEIVCLGEILMQENHI